MQKKAIAVFGLGFGDEGKGAVIDKIARTTGATLVVKANGGCQAQHNVVTDDGKHFPFSQMGSASFDFAETHISSYFLFEPLSFAKEYDAFNKIMGNGGPELIVTVDPRALVTTKFHWIANREIERSRGDARHGSTGRGIGQTMQYSIDFPEYAIRYEDLTRIDILKEKLYEMAEYYGNDEINVEDLADDMVQSAEPRSFACKDEDILSEHAKVIFEHSQGVLLDEDHGFHPHTTWSKTTTANTDEMLAGRDEYELVKVGCLRSYMTRHGHGPFPTYYFGNTDFQRVSEPHNSTTEWAGAFRKGYMDEVLIRYALLQQGQTDFIALNHSDTVVPDIIRGDDTMLSRELYEAPADKRTDLVQKQRVDLVGGQPWNYTFIEDLLGIPVGVLGYGPKTQHHNVSKQLFKENTREENAGYL